MANRERGEVDVDLGGTTYTLRPTFQALCEIEDRTGVGLGTLLRRYSDGDFGVRDVAVVLWAGMRGFDERAPAFDEVGRMVVEHGVASLAVAAGAFLAGALTGDRAGQAQERTS